VKKLAALAAVMALIVLAAAPLAAAWGRECRVLFVIYGDPRCPHCRATNRTLNMLFPGCVVFHDISSNSTANRVYTGMWNAIFGNSFYAVPLVVVKLNGKPKAFVVGEKPAEFWQQLAQRIASNPPKTALVCLEPSLKHCIVLSKEKYLNTLNVIARGGIKITLIACKGLPDTVIKAIYGTSCRGSIPESLVLQAIHEFNATVNTTAGYKYLFVYGLIPVLTVISPGIPGMIVVKNKTINVENLVASITAKIALQGLKTPVVIYIFMKGKTPMVGLKAIPSNETLAHLLWSYAEKARRKPLAVLIPALLGLAALDSINPCFLALYTMLIVAAAATGGAMAAVTAGLAVTLGVYTGYYLLGLGIAQALEVVGWPLRLLLAALMIILGARSIYEAYRERKKRRPVAMQQEAQQPQAGGAEPAPQQAGVEAVEGECRICRLIDIKGLKGPLALYGFGLLASWTLLPCTAGPYVAALVLLEGYSLPAKLALLALYNAVFIAPLLAVMVASTKIVEKYRRLVPYAELVAGVALIILGVVVILEHFGIIPVII